MPFMGEDKGIISKIVSLTGSSLFPVSLSLLLPIFMYNIVQEKEEKILEMMKMNGLKLKDYWIITVLFYLLITILTFSVFWVFGLFILQLKFFVDTSLLLMFLVLLGWGFA